jgi:hypothetical protein
MRDKILSALKTKFQNLGFSEKAYGGVADFLAATVTDDTQIETGISGVEPLLKAFQGDIDTRVTTALAKQKAELERKPADPPKPSDPPKPGDDVPQWAKDLQARVEGYERKERQAAIAGKLRGKLKDKGVPDSFLKHVPIDITDEAQIDTVAANIETEWNEHRQELINSGLMVDVPRRSQDNPKEGADLGKAIAERRNTAAGDMGIKGKEI